VHLWEPKLNHESNSTGETRQDLKIPTVSDGSLPRALSCSHHEVYPLQSAVPLLCGGVFSFLPVQLGSC